MALISKSSQLSAHRRDTAAVEMEPLVRTPPINRVHRVISDSLHHAKKASIDEAYDYTAFSWRGIGAAEKRRVDIYQSDKDGQVTACLWKEARGENNTLSGYSVAVFSVTNVTAVIKVINKWINGETRAKLRRYIIANRNSFLDADLN